MSGLTARPGFMLGKAMLSSAILRGGLRLAPALSLAMAVGAGGLAFLRHGAENHQPALEDGATATFTDMTLEPAR